ncbi:MAG: extracellular solute-binding protein, partial [Clostridia bacterium]
IGDAEGYGKYPEAFTKGHVGVMFGGLSQVDKVETAKVNFKVLPLPKAKDGTQRSHTFLNCWTVPTKTSNTAWAWKVVEYFSGAEGQKIAVDSGMGLPGSKTADIKTWAEAKEYRHYFVEALNYAGTVPYPTGVNATRWQSEFIKQIADKIMNVKGLTAEKLEAAIIKMDNKLQYIFFGG